MIDLIESLRADIAELFEQRDEYRQRMQKLMTTVSELTAERDTYAAAADTMAAAHKVECDELRSTINAACISAIRQEREIDALKDAARLASRALQRIDAADIRLDTGERLSIAKAIAALKAVL